MLFGKKRVEPPEKVSVSGLMLLLNRLFDSSMSDFVSKSDRIMERIDEDWKLFSSTCESFDSDAMEPDLEDLPHMIEANVATMRGNYVRAMYEIVEEGRIDVDYPTLYETYKARLDDHLHRINQVLQVNHRFRPVIIAYAKGLDRFKKTFSNLEKHANEMKACVVSYHGRFLAYSNGRTMVETLAAHLESIDRMSSELREHSSVEKPPEVGNDLEKSMEENRNSMKAAEKRLSALKEELNGMLTPLERAARKFDHMNEGREKLSRYLSDTESLRESHGRFMEMLGLLSKAIRENAIEVRNPEEIEGKISEIRGCDLPSILGTMRSLEEELSTLREASGAYSRRLRGIHEKRDAAREKERMAEQLSNDLREAEKSKLEMKANIESMFSREYGKHLEVQM